MTDGIVAQATTYRLEQLIRDAARHGELVVFVGAGASVLCGSPNWVSFAAQVVDALESAGGLNFLEAEQLRTIPDPRRTLSVALKLAEEYQVDIDFDKILHPGAPKQPGADLYQLLSDLNPVFVTTNYDKWLDIQPLAAATEASSTEAGKEASVPVARSTYFRREDLTSDRLTERGAVIHLHGSYREPLNMVVSLRDYIQHYADESVKTFLAEMFRSHTVLFVGYGLSELEVLDYVIRSQDQATPRGEARHFLLYPHRSSEAAQTTFIQRFFKDQCGVQVLPYCIDKKGYPELVEVFRSWAPLLDVREPSILELQAHLDRCIKEQAVASRRQAAIRSVEKHPQLLSYLLNALRDPVWFEDLDRAEFFDVRHRAGMKRVEQQGSTYYQFENWPALRYLEQIAPGASTPTAQRILEIVRTVDADAVSSGVENWRTLWTLAGILAHMPLSLITNSDIEATRRWLHTPFDANMIATELGQKLLPRLVESADPADLQKALQLTDVLTALREGEE